MRSVRRGLSSGPETVATYGAFAAPALADEPADAASAGSHDSVFEVPVTAPRVPSNMRGLRAGNDSLLLDGFMRPGLAGAAGTQPVANNDDESHLTDLVEAQPNAS